MERPRRGQGKMLPVDCGYIGQWIMENSIFLYQPPKVDKLGGAAPEMVAKFKVGDNWCVGFNAARLAFSLKVTNKEIFEHNRLGTLLLLGAEIIPATGADIIAQRFTLQIGREITAVVQEWGGPTGHA